MSIYNKNIRLNEQNGVFQCWLKIKAFKNIIFLFLKIYSDYLIRAALCEHICVLHKDALFQFNLQGRKFYEI